MIHDIAATVRRSLQPGQYAHIVPEGRRLTVEIGPKPETARAALLAYQEAGKLDAVVGVVAPSPAPELADLLRKRYPRLLTPGNELYDAVLADAVGRAAIAAPADVVTVPRVILSALGRVAQEAAWLRHGRCRGYEDLWNGPLGDIDGALNALDALRSSAQAEGGGR